MKITDPNEYQYTTHNHVGNDQRVMTMLLDQFNRMTFYTVHPGVILNNGTPNARVLELRWRSACRGWDVFLPGQDEPFTTAGSYTQYCVDPTYFPTVIERLTFYLYAHPQLEATLCPT